MEFSKDLCDISHTHTQEPQMLLVFLISLFLNLECIATKQVKADTVGIQGAFLGQMGH